MQDMNIEQLRKDISISDKPCPDDIDDRFTWAEAVERRAGRRSQLERIALAAEVLVGAVEYYKDQFCEAGAVDDLPSCGLLTEHDCQGCRAAQALAAYRKATK